MSQERQTGLRGRSRLSAREGSAKQRRNSALPTTADDFAPPLMLDADSRITLKPMPKIDLADKSFKNLTQVVTKLITALQDAGLMEK